jgi:hypothetical protein
MCSIIDYELFVRQNSAFYIKNMIFGLIKNREVQYFKLIQWKLDKLIS